MHIGCHVSIAGGMEKAPERAGALGCECLQMFSRSPQGGKAPKITPAIAERFKDEMKRHHIAYAYIHTPYYINLASADNRIRHGSASVIRDELDRGSMLGVTYVMTHLGSAKEIGRDAAIAQTAKMLAEALDGYAGITKLLLENAAGAGEIIGDDFSELKKIIMLAGSKHIAGVCLDTQHAFASGYDWRTKKSFDDAVARIETELGWKYVKLMHANDSKVELGAKRDRHEHIGEGHIGKEGFRNIVAIAQRHNIDMILETPHDKVEQDMRILKTFRDDKK